MADEAFSDRVKKTFGSLLTSVKPSSLSNPLWSLTGTEVEKREWRRDKDTSDRDSNPCSSSFNDFISDARKNSRRNLKNYCKELDDGDELEDDKDEDEDEFEGNDKGLDDTWDVRANIGLDSTLDFEEEEDTYDKVAIGREDASDRLYMRDITGKHDSRYQSLNDAQKAIWNLQRDPRANRMAAKVRLKEDDAEIATQSNLHAGGQVPSTRTDKEFPSSGEKQDNLKPILKRKEHESISKPTKRVRFDPGWPGVNDAPSEVDSMEHRNQDSSSPLIDEKVSRVPDYVKNPSKYQCYNLDSTRNMSEKSDTGVFLDASDLVKMSQQAGAGSDKSDASMDLPKSITFIPKKKSGNVDVCGVSSESTQAQESCVKPPSLQSTSPISIAVENVEESECGDMEIDEPESSVGNDVGSTSKVGARRQYRAKPGMDMST